ncbi:MAG: succinate dehydrogenase, hydrophobic membrane anchor protein [Mariprofundaceae bacterium]|nr:succinate dehydrogenase, hydrophobic membrane anchor protein [Mariprofundaceae bacterium]
MNKEHDLGAAHTGFHDWYWQRISAVALLLFLPALFGIFLAVYFGKVNYFTLNQWLTHPSGKILCSILLLSLAMHLWTGLKVIIEDYIHFAAGRVILLNLILLLLIFIGGYAAYVIWAEVSYNFLCVACTHLSMVWGEI